MTFKDAMKWAWSTKPFRYFAIGFILLTTWLVIREVNYEKWYGDETVIETVDTTLAGVPVDTLVVDKDSTEVNIDALKLNTTETNE